MTTWLNPHRTGILLAALALGVGCGSDDSPGNSNMQGTMTGGAGGTVGTGGMGGVAPGPMTGGCVENQSQACMCQGTAQMGASVCQGGTWQPCVCTGGGTGGAGAGGAPGGDVCGDGVRTGAEVCDGLDHGAANCATETMNVMPTGMLTCTATCTFDLSGCIGMNGAGGNGMGGMTGGGGMAGGGGLTQ